MADVSADSSSLETRKDAEKQAGLAKYWMGQIDLADKDHRDFIKNGKDVQKRYKGEQSKVGRGSKRFNILFSNTETLKAALFARMAKPDIRRRFSDRDPIGKQIAEMVERASIYCQDTYDSEKAVEHAIEDYLLPGRGIVRVCYEAETTKGDNDKEYVSGQDLYEEYVPWDDFRHEPAKTWDRVTWEAFRHKMSRDDLKKNFSESLGSRVNEVPLNWSPNPDDSSIPDSYKRAEVWEIFDKTKRERVWIVKGFDEPLRVDDDPFGLEKFFPNAEPLQAITTNDTLIPEPEFHIYRDQADGLDEIENRIDKLTRAMRRRGVYDATFKELARLAKANDNEFVAVHNYADLSQKGGLAAAFQSEDLGVIAKVLAELHQQRDLRVQTIYEVAGIADIMRGSTDPRETLGAQKIKAQFGNNRLKKRQDKVQKWIRDTLRIKCEILAEHFEPQKLAAMTGFQFVPQAPVDQQTGQPGSVEGLITPDMIKVMRSDRLRSYRIDVETDSTIFEDAESEKQAVTEMLTAASTFVSNWAPVLQSKPEMLDMAFEMLSFGLRHFKMGRSLEEVIEQTKQKLQQAAQQPAPPDPKVQAEQAKAQAIQQKAQIDQQAAQQKAQLDAQKMQLDLQAQQQKQQMEMQKMQAELAFMREKMGLEMQQHQAEMAMDAQRMDMEAEAASRRAEMGAEADERKHELGLEMMAEKAKQAKQKPRGEVRQ